VFKQSSKKAYIILYNIYKAFTKLTNKNILFNKDVIPFTNKVLL
jgi:hypothetical protein